MKTADIKVGHWYASENPYAWKRHVDAVENGKVVYHQPHMPQAHPVLLKTFAGWAQKDVTEATQ